MLSPNDISPKGKAPSIWSFDSGYGSNTVEDEDQVDLLPQPGPSTEQRSGQQSIGLGLSGLGIGTFWNVHVEDKLRVRRSESPIVPVTTRLNVFTTRDTLTTTLPLPTLANEASKCITCQLWNLTNQGQGLECDGCKSKDFVRPEVLHFFDTEPKEKQVVPQLEIPQVSRRRQSFKPRNEARCTACELAFAIDPHTSVACPSCAPNPDLLSPDSPVQTSTVKRSCARRHTKLPPHALRVLRAWLNANRDHPYPSSDTKRALAEECGITEKQVTTWFTNTRARKLPLLNDVSHGSSGDEGAYESDFSNITNTPSCTTSPMIRYDTPSSHPYDPSASGQSNHVHPQLALQTARRGKKKDYRRMNTVSPIDDSPVPRTPATPSPNPLGQRQETWPCTFCPQALAPKSWRRHEETQHRPKHQWTCLATGPRLRISSGLSICAFCQIKNPSEDHLLNSHRILECSKKSEADRTFGRPDHLRQHIKNFHKTSLLALVRDKWRSLRPGHDGEQAWPCGFCEEQLATWDARETHISNHFKDGKTMADWRDPTRNDTPAMDDDERRKMLREEHANTLTRLQESLAASSRTQSEPPTLLDNRQPVTFDLLPSSTGGSNLAAVPALLNTNDDMDFPTYMSETFMNSLDFSGPSAMDDLDALYPMPNDDYGYDICIGDEDLPLEYASNLDIFGNPIDFQNGWEHSQR